MRPSGLLRLCREASVVWPIMVRNHFVEDDMTGLINCEEIVLSVIFPEPWPEFLSGYEILGLSKCTSRFKIRVRNVVSKKVRFMPVIVRFCSEVHAQVDVLPQICFGKHQGRYIREFPIQHPRWGISAYFIPPGSIDSTDSLLAQHIARIVRRIIVLLGKSIITQQPPPSLKKRQERKFDLRHLQGTA